MSVSEAIVERSNIDGPAGNRPARGRSNRTAWRAVRVGAFIAITIVVALSARSIDWSRTSDALHQARLGWVAAAMVANTGITLTWTAFLLALLPAGAGVGYPRMFEMASITLATMNTVPFLGGHATAIALFVKRGGLSMQAALSVMALDQLGEGVAKVLILFAAGLLAPLPTWMHVGVTMVTLGVAALFVGLVAFAQTRYPWARHLDALRDWRQAARALAAVLATKVAEAAAIVAVQRAFGITLGMDATLLVLAVVMLATMVPVAPGNLGTYEASVFVAYRYLGLPAEQAVAMAVVQHLCFMVPAVGIGYLVAAARSLRA